MTFLFFILLICVVVFRALPIFIFKNANGEGDVWLKMFAIVMGIGLVFVFPLILNWCLAFLFGFTLNYFKALLSLMVLYAFIGRVDVVI